MKRLAAVIAITLLAAVASWPEQALGHAALTRADPPENAFVQRPPSEIALTFSEFLDSRLSSIRLLDAAGKPVAAGELAFGKNVMRLPLRTLKPGIYNVLWTNVSSIDGHSLQGSYPFTVLQADGSLPSEVNTVSGLGTDSDPPPEDDGVAVRALALLGLLVAAAGPILLLLGGTAAAALRRPLTQAMLLGTAVLAVATVLNFAVIRDTYSGLAVPDLVLNTRAGNYWLARAGAVLLLAVVASFVGDTPRGAAAAALAAVLAYLWSYSATSHAAAGTGSAWATATDMLHSVAAVTWIAGVIGVALVARLRGRTADYPALMPRFGVLASVSVFVLLATGVLSAFVELDTPARLTETRYGVTLLVKLGLMVGLLGFAAYNARWGRARLMSNAPGEPRRFLAMATAEILLGLGVFLAAAMLTQSTASKLIPESRASRPFDQTTAVAGLNVRLEVSPNRTGLNSYRVSLTGADGQPADAQRVRLTFRYRDDQTIGPSTLVLAQSPDTGVFRGQGPYLTLEGQWRIETEIRRANADDATAFYDIRPAGTAVATTRSGGTWSNPAPGLSWNEFGGLVALLAGLGLALFKRHLVRMGKRVALGATGTTAAMFGVGTLLLFGVHTHEPGAAGLPANPVFPDQNSVARGRTLYQANCVSCHGRSGVPPEGLNLNPYPLDLTVHAPQHPDGQLFLFINDGLPGTAMRSWGAGPGKLSKDDIWHLVNFLRTLGPTDR